MRYALLTLADEDYEAPADEGSEDEFVPDDEEISEEEHEERQYLKKARRWVAGATNHCKPHVDWNRKGAPITLEQRPNNSASGSVNHLLACMGSFVNFP